MGKGLYKDCIYIYGGIQGSIRIRRKYGMPKKSESFSGALSKGLVELGVGWGPDSWNPYSMVAKPKLWIWSSDATVPILSTSRPKNMFGAGLWRQRKAAATGLQKAVSTLWPHFLDNVHSKPGINPSPQTLNLKKNRRV